MKEVTVKKAGTIKADEEKISNFADQLAQIFVAQIDQEVQKQKGNEGKNETAPK